MSRELEVIFLWLKSAIPNYFAWTDSYIISPLAFSWLWLYIVFFLKHLITAHDASSLVCWNETHSLWTKYGALSTLAHSYCVNHMSSLSDVYTVSSDSSVRCTVFKDMVRNMLSTSTKLSSTTQRGRNSGIISSQRAINACFLALPCTYSLSFHALFLRFNSTLFRDRLEKRQNRTM